MAVGWKGDVSSPHSSAATTPSAACLPDADSPPQPQERLRDLAGPGYDAEALAAFYTEVLVPSFPDKNDVSLCCFHVFDGVLLFSLFLVLVCVELDVFFLYWKVPREILFYPTPLACIMVAILFLFLFLSVFSW